MNTEKKGLAIIFHSSSYDHLYHGLAIGIAALALGREVRFLFTYWALEYLRKSEILPFKLNEESQAYKEILDKNLKEGHMLKIRDLLTETKAMGAKFYACSSSMALLNIARDELNEEVDESIGITTFLTETVDNQLLFI